MYRNKLLAVGLLSASLALAVHAAGNPVTPDALATRSALAQGGRALTLPSQAAPASVAATYLRQRGHSDATVRSLKIRSDSRHDDRRHLRMAQEVGGLMVYDTYVKATVNRRGELLGMVENLAPVPAGGVTRAAVGEATALAAAFRELKIAGAVPQVATRRGNTTSFAKARGFSAAPTVTRVAIPMSDGTLSTGFLVETWRVAGNLLHETLVDGNGNVVETIKRTNSDSYNVFTIDPNASPQSIVAGPGGWLFGGTHRTIDIAGNNVHAYLDTVNDSVPEPGGTDVTDGNFLTAFDPGIQPSAGSNPNVAVQNLFYLNNLIHDTLYAAGFDEAAGNFQEDNFGLRGGSDSVNAEAQDGGGTDNANFATPHDGNNPRMQMYLWSSPLPDHEVLINAPAALAGSLYGARRAAFGGALDATGLTDDVTLVNDGTGTTTDACEPIANAADVANKIALIDRGTCTFVIKVKNAQDAGAVGVIMVNNQGDDPIVMGGVDATITIPAVMIGQSNGTILKGATGVNATLRLLDPAPIMQDSSLDTDIVWHEYGHGLTWRMIGRMNGPMSGAIGEGMSDVLAIIANDNDVVAEYSGADPGGIRSEPYANYSRTYGDIAGAGVHFDGEVYGAIGWRLWKHFQAAGLSKDDTLGFIVDGMNYTPAHPSFEDMRDGILAATAGSGHECLVWDAFADYGVGVDAKGKAKVSVLGVRMVITESFALPAGCTAIP